MSTPSPSTSPWRKSSRSGDTGGDCVEITVWRKSSRSGHTGGDCVEITILTSAPGRREPKLG
ncbi:hypothetical protein GCM10023196_031330 [Actinoallomurus vinaceus]|uniref:DUF397 domain-containing protein n=1 Tax=Actinoallomurus vinaceus TaxID=1080074 RepID=A0ABP8U9H2_9ACTN